MSGSRDPRWWHIPASLIGMVWGLTVLTIGVWSFGGAIVLWSVAALLDALVRRRAPQDALPPVPRLVPASRRTPAPAFVFAATRRVQQLHAFACLAKAVGDALLVYTVATRGPAHPVRWAMTAVLGMFALVSVVAAVSFFRGLRTELAVQLTPTGLVAAGWGQKQLGWAEIGAVVVEHKRKNAHVRVTAPVDPARQKPGGKPAQGASMLLFPAHLLGGDPEFVRWVIEHYAHDAGHRAAIGTESEYARLLAWCRPVAVPAGA